MESTLGYHPLFIEHLTVGVTKLRTVSGGQFDWGGRLPKSNGGAQRFPQRERKPRKSYPGDNRLISPKSPYRRGGLAPRCRLITSWGWSRSQGLGCSPIKVVRELGSERRETVRSISIAGVRDLKGAAPSTRGPEWTDQWCTNYPARGTVG